MDPYEQTQSSTSIPDDFVDDEEQFKELETELAPKDADYYGILNISKQASINLVVPVIASRRATLTPFSALGY